MFSLPAKPYDEAVIDLAQKAQVAVGGADVRLCGQMAPALSGRMSAYRALNELLKGSRCEVEQIGPSEFAVRPRIGKSPANANARAPLPDSVPAVLAETIVTGYRRPELLGASPASISVIAGDVIDQRPEDLGAIAAYVPGLKTTDLGPGRDKILLRGLSDGVFTGRTQSTVGLYLDDTPITYDAPDPDLLLYDLARIEVLKGPQGALYGEGSMSGVVRLVTRRPDLDAWTASLGTGAGMTLNGAPSTRLTAMTNIPLVADRLGLRAVFYDDQAGGYIRDLSLQQDNINQTRRYGGRLALTWRIDDNWRLSSSLAAQSLASSNSQYVTGNLGPYVRSVGIAEPSSSDFAQGAATLDGDTAIGALKISVNHVDHQPQSRLGADGVIPYLSTPSSGSIAYDAVQRIELTTGEISLSSLPDLPLRWLAGLFGSSSQEQFEPRLTDLVFNRDIYSENRSDHVSDQAVFGEVTYDIGRQWSLQGGLRLSESHLSVRSVATEDISAAPSTRQIDESLSATRLSSLFMVSYRPAPPLTLYLQSSEGYRSGGFNTTSLASTSTVPASYAGDELNNYEAGMRLRTSDDRGLFTVALFQAVWRNIQSDQLQPSGLPMTVNVGDGVNTGLELEASWRVLPELDFQSAAQFNNPRLTRPNPPFSNSDDPGLPFIGRVNVSLGANWRTRLGSAEIESSATVAYQSASHLNFGLFQEATMGGFATLNLASAIDMGKIRYSLRLDNVTDVRANTFAYGNPFTLAAGPQFTPLRPATVWLSATFNY